MNNQVTISIRLPLHIANYLADNGLYNAEYIRTFISGNIHNIYPHVKSHDEHTIIYTLKISKALRRQLRVKSRQHSTSLTGFIYDMFAKEFERV